MKNLKPNSDSLYVPSKTFIWGEYSALLGGPAAVVATPPSFVFSQNPLYDEKNQRVSEVFEFHELSPASQFLDHCKKQFQLQESEIKDLRSCHLYDPHSRTGGFGLSTAELIYVYKKINSRIEMNPQSLWTLYRQLASVDRPPSGYDLMAQLFSGFNLLSVVGDQIRREVRPWPFTRLGFLLFKTKLKVPTHQHLKTLDYTKLKPLVGYSERVTQCYLEGDQEHFLSALKTFEVTLKHLGLVCEPTQKIIEELRSWSHIEHVKGCGAMGADVVAVFYKKQYKQEVLKQASDHFAEKLNFITDEESVESVMNAETPKL